MLFLLPIPPDRQRPDQGLQNSSWQKAKLSLSLVVALSTIQVTEQFSSISPQFRGKTPWGWSGTSHLSSPSTNLMRRLAARRLFKVPHAAKALLLFQTSMSSPGFEPSPYGTAMSTEETAMDSGSVSEIEKRKSIQEMERIDSEIDKEVKDEQYDDFKTKIEILVQVGKDELRSCTLTDCYTTDRPGLHLEILPKIIFEAVDGETSVEEIDVQKPIFRQTVDQGTQASIEYKSSKAQTLRRRMVNSWSQYEPRLFTEQDVESHLNQPSFQIFRENTEER
ncbi:WD repeat-containing protein 63 [Trichonephila clavipes]|nr:WD repeat-containing protein 63 [Trichonephila clavipes]